MASHLVSRQEPDISACVEIPKNNNSSNRETAVDDYVDDDDDYFDTEKKRKQKPKKKKRTISIKVWYLEFLVFVVK